MRAWHILFPLKFGVVSGIYVEFFGGRVICVKCSKRSFGVRLFFFLGGGAYASSLVYIELHEGLSLVKRRYLTLGSLNCSNSTTDC